MVFYFECSDPRYTIYMGRDKFENEHLIANGWPEDLWFHVDNHSSAHVYLRLPKGDTISDVPDDIVAECSQLTKANSIEGSKLSHVRIIYTQWSNLKKTEGMADGQVGYHNRTAVRFHMVEHRINAVVNRLNKTKVEKHNNPNELRELRRLRDETEASDQRSEREEQKKVMSAEAKAARREAAEKAEEAAESARKMDYDPTRARSLEAILDEAAATTPVQRPKKKSGKLKMRDNAVDAGLNDAADLFGVARISASKTTPSKAAGMAAGATTAGGTTAGLETVAPSAGVDTEAASTADGEGVGGWFEEEDDDPFWLSQAVDVSEEGAGGMGTDGGAGGTSASKWRDREGGSLGALGMEAEKVAASRHTDDEMERLTRAAHERKAAATKRAEEAAARKAEKDAQAAAELELRRDKLDGKRAEVAAAAARGAEAAGARLVADRESGALVEALEANEATREEECMVLEAVNGEEAFKRIDAAGDADAPGGAEMGGEGGGAGAYPAFSLEVTGERGGGGEARVVLRVRTVAEYPSHLPPSVEIADGVEEGDRDFVCDSLRALFYAQREESAAAEEPAEGVVHQWAEWLREEWIAAR